MLPYLHDTTIYHKIRLDRVESEHGVSEKVFIPEVNSNPCFCIFCLKNTSQGATFEKDAHFLPAGLGNNTYFNNKRECDTCNGTISTYESSLINYLTVDRIFSRGSSRRAFKELVKETEDGSYFKSKPNNKNKIEIGLIENGQIEVDLSTNTMKLNINTSINFEYLCKAITHSVWSVLNDNIRAELDHIREWLITPQKILVTVK